MELGLQWPPRVESLSVRPNGAGRVFFVRSTGADTNNGLEPETPFQTVTYALTQCTDGGNDYIVLMNNTSALEASFPIVIAKSFIHLIGMWGAPYPNPTLMADDDNPTIRIEDGTTWVEIGGIDFGGGATNGCIQIGSDVGNTSYIWIHHCSFGWDAGIGAQDGIRWLLTHPDAQTYVEDCHFGGLLTRDGCRLDGNNTRGVYRRNIFRDIQGVGINVNVNGADVGAILDNVFASPIADALGNGWGILFIVGAGCALVMGNVGGQTGDATGTSPFVDLSTGAIGTKLNMWAGNIVANAFANPDNA